MNFTDEEEEEAEHKIEAKVKMGVRKREREREREREENCVREPKMTLVERSSKEQRRSLSNVSMYARVSSSG